MNTRNLCTALVAVGCLLGLGSVRADDIAYSTAAGGDGAYNGCNSGCGGCCNNLCGDCCCCESGAWFVDAEALFLKYGRADGTQNGANPVQFGYDIAPRVALGYVGPQGLGARVRFFEFSHNAFGVAPATDQIFVNAWMIDSELFQRVQLTCNTNVEFSGGVRYVNFREVLAFGAAGAVTEDTRFSGAGGVVGLQVNRRLGFGEVYARARGSILMGDKTYLPGGPPPATLFDSVLTIAEISLGYQACWQLGNGMIVTLRSGVEWQHWTDFSVSQNLSGDDESSVGFFGFLVGGGLTF